MGDGWDSLPYHAFFNPVKPGAPCPKWHKGYPASYQGHFPPRPARARVFLAMLTTKAKFRCATCEMTEERCDCDRYCYICLGQHAVRLCEDGLYYCAACREACDYVPQEPNAH